MKGNLSRRAVISASILTADFSDIRKVLRQLEKAKINWLHLDVMDGHFVPNLTFGPPLVAKWRQCTQMIFDAHLMVEKPSTLIKDFAGAGVNYLTIHQEIKENLAELISQIRRYQMLAGLSIKPATATSTILPYLRRLSMVLVMSVEPGFGGQKFIPETLARIRQVRQFINQVNPRCLLAVDGGITPENYSAVVKAGADILVVGNYLFSGTSIFKQVKKFDLEI